MALFLPNNIQPLVPASNIDNWDDLEQNQSSLSEAEFFKRPEGLANRIVEIDYIQL